ncbi:probable histone-lysine N-methyltransferase set-23 [Anoplophora glabripennis]|uniref:probable histone-lysine N-methyltransferase set-23 n=1 Tax=Anoplophora glabripennis TaxID=217634 RepID=UPI0008741185|nr:probable histone-lysine N-methyltransferase set-23 [Anoplophora glabripennis]
MLSMGQTNLKKYKLTVMEFTDEYDHNVPGVMYFPKSLPCKEVQDLYNYTLDGCKCETECTKHSACSCIGKSGTFYNYDNIYDTTSYMIHENTIDSPTYECNENCSCNKRVCGNRLVQFGPRKNLKIQFCGNGKGSGLFTADEIKKGNFVCEYAGEIITENQAFARFSSNSEQNKMNYIFCIKEHFGEKEVKTFIDPSHYGNLGRYINHSCEPNCKLYVVRINDAMPVLGIFANEDIKENSEITYNYGEGDLGIDNCGKYVKKKCLCNSQGCRKYLPFDVSLST